MTDLHQLLETTQARRFDKATMFNHPDDVLGDPDLTIAEKRIVLASWVSDANAVPHLPAMRQLPNGTVVKAEDILHALKTLDARDDTGSIDPSRALSWRAPFERRRGWVFKNAKRRGRGSDDDDPPPTPAYAMLRPRGGGGATCAHAQLMPA